MFHTFSYDVHASSMLIAVKAWSDFGAHIPMIRSFSLGNNWPPQYPLFPDAPIRYHFLFYFLVGMLEKIGLRIDFALNIPSIIGLVGLSMAIAVLAQKLFRDKRITVLSLLFFFCNGSLSFIRFFNEHPLSPTTIRDIVTNTRYPSFAPWDTGDITAFWNFNIYTNQRHLGAAFALGLLFILILLFIEKKPWKKQLPFLVPEVGIIALLPFFHQPTLLMIAIVMSCYFILFPKLRGILLLIGLFGITATIPQVMSLTAGPKTFIWQPWYLMTEPLTVWHAVPYWFHNIGLHLILIPLGWILAPKQIKKVTFPIFIIFLFGNLFQCSVEMAANHKFFNFFLIIGNMLSAYVLVKTIDTVKRSSHMIIRMAAYVCVGISVCILVLSGVIDLFPIINDRYIPLVDIPDNEAATWIRDNTQPDAIFLNSSYFFHPASIAGRKIFMGWPYFPWSAGYDTRVRSRDMERMYDTTDMRTRCALFDKYHISYITVEDTHDDPNLPSISVESYEAYTPVYAVPSNRFLIFSITDLCK